MKAVAFLTLAALASAATIVIAAPEGGKAHRGAAMMERLKAADTNADGRLSRSEVAALPRLAERFDAIDADRDGQVTYEELRAFHRAHRGNHKLRADADGDGKVSRDEVLARAAERFDRADANKDGFLTQDEMKSQRGKRHHHHGK